MLFTLPLNNAIVIHILERGKQDLWFNRVREKESKGSQWNSFRRGTGAFWPVMRKTGRKRNAWKKVILLMAAWNSFYGCS